MGAVWTLPTATLVKTWFVTCYAACRDVAIASQRRLVNLYRPEPLNIETLIDDFVMVSREMTRKNRVVGGDRRRL